MGARESESLAVLLLRDAGDRTGCAWRALLLQEHLYIRLAVLSAPLLNRYGEGWLPFVGCSEERCSLQ